jgi:hypothetical protein
MGVVTTGEQRTRMPGVVDRHVHLGLVDGARLEGTAVVEVHDLGWTADEARRWRRDGVGGARVRVAGPFLTAPGGAPEGLAWAPRRAVREIGDVAAARAAVVAATALGLDMVAVVLHADAPPFPEQVLGVLVGEAHAAGLTVVAHANGPGQVALAAEVGVDVLAAVPWTEPVDDRVLL